MIWNELSHGYVFSDREIETLSCAVYKIISDPNVAMRDKLMLARDVIDEPLDHPRETHRVLEALVASIPFETASFTELASTLEVFRYTRALEEIAACKELGYEDGFREVLARRVETIDLPYLARVRIEQIIHPDRDVAYNADVWDPFGDQEFERIEIEQIEDPMHYAVERELYDTIDPNDLDKALVPLEYRDIDVYPFPIAPGMYAERSEHGYLWLLESPDEVSMREYVEARHAKRKTNEAEFGLRRAHNHAIDDIATKFGYDRFVVGEELFERNPYLPREKLFAMRKMYRELTEEAVSRHEKALSHESSVIWPEWESKIYPNGNATTTEVHTGVRRRPLEVNDVFPSVADEDEAVREQGFEACDYLVSYWARERLQEEFDVDLATLPLREQGAFLNFLSQFKESEVVRVREFTNKYSTAGARVLLAGRYGAHEAERIIELGEVLPNHEAANLFARYLGVTDSAQQLELQLKEFATDRERYHDIGDVRLHVRAITQIHEALVRRSKDLLLASHAIMWGQEKALVIDDEHTVLSATKLLLEILQGLQGDSGYEVVERICVSQPDHQVTKFLIRDTTLSEKEEEQYEYTLKIRVKETFRGLILI